MDRDLAYAKEIGDGKLLAFGLEYKDAWSAANIEFRVMDKEEE